MSICNICQKEFKSLYALSAHKRAHLNYTQKPIYCCSILTKQKISVSCLSKHEKAWIKNSQQYAQCLQCSKPLTKLKNKFCSSSCAATYNNLHSSPNRKHGPAPKEKPPKSSFTHIVKNTCAKSGIVFFAKTYRKYHPNLQHEKDDYSRSCKFRFSISQFPNWFDGSIIKKYEMYSTPGSRIGVKNLNGVSRDHLYSISDGWLNNIDSKFIRHPANCQLVRHKDNQQKNRKSPITLNELLSRIKKFEELYPVFSIY